MLEAAGKPYGEAESLRGQRRMLRMRFAIERKKLDWQRLAATL